MDHWFDDVSRRLASPLPRRRVLAMIAGSVAGSALGAIWPGGTAVATGPPCLGCTVPGAFICGTTIYTDFGACIAACQTNPRVCFCQSCSPACPPGQVDCNGLCCPAGQACLGTLGCAVAISTAVTYVGENTADVDDVATLAATLVDTSVSPAVAVPGAILTFTLGSQSCTATTDGGGRATCFLTLNETPGSYTVGVSFAATGTFLASNTSAPFTVTKEEATLTYTGDTLIANGRTAQLSAVLKEDTTTPIVGRTVAFTLGSGPGAQVCSGTTDASGIASCTISPVSQPPGPGTVTAQFAGDVLYLPASATAATVAFAYLPSGSFVVGDRDASMGNMVTFWGAHWAKANSLSGGPSPASFKGFAASLSSTPPACGGTWSTSPDNSTGPPGTVPPYMGVVVSSSVTQSDSTLSGNTPAVIVVLTQSGYAPNPGHPGTGTVVAMVCPTRQH